MFEFFPHIVIVIAVALVVVIAARSFPAMRRGKAAQDLEKEKNTSHMSSSNKKFSDIKQKDGSSKKPASEKKKKRFSMPSRRRLPVDESAEDVSVSLSKSESVLVKQKAKHQKAVKKKKKSQSKKDDLIEDLLKDSPVALDDDKKRERREAHETKKQLHENALKVIDRVAYLGKRSYSLAKKGSIATVAFVKVKHAEFKRSRMSQGEIDQEKIVDLLADAAKNLGGKLYKEAEENYIEIIKLDPKNIRAYKGLAEIYELQGSYDDAISSIDFASKLDPLDRKLQQETSRLRKLKREKEDRKDIKEVKKGKEKEAEEK